jgi:predicted RNase H-like HicB family nuclease
MFYPAYVHKDPKSAYGISFPDFPGCFSAADTLADLPKAAQEAVEVHFEGEDLAVPAPSTPERWAKDRRYRGGFWLLVHIDLSKVSSKAIRVNISLPEDLVQRIDSYARARHISRSGFQKVTSLIQQDSCSTFSTKPNASNISMVRQAIPSVWPSCSGPSFCSTMQLLMSANAASWTASVRLAGPQPTISTSTCAGGVFTGWSAWSAGARREDRQFQSRLGEVA